MESNWATPLHFLKLAVKLKAKLLNIFVMAADIMAAFLSD